MAIYCNRTINASTQERELAPALVQFVLPPRLFTLSSTSSLFLVRATLITAAPTAFLQSARAVMPHASTSLLREQTTATPPHSNQLPVQKEVHDQQARRISLGVLPSLIAPSGQYAPPSSTSPHSGVRSPDCTGCIYHLYTMSK